MEQHTTEIQQELLSGVNGQALECLPGKRDNTVATPADFGGYEPYVDEFVIARFLQMKPRRVLEMARDGELPAHPIGRGVRNKWRFRISEIDAHFSEQRRPTGANLSLAVPGATRRKQ